MMGSTRKDASQSIFQTDTLTLQTLKKDCYYLRNYVCSTAVNDV